MTVLIGASVLLIAASAIALVFGWTGADQSLIWTSIAATAAAAVALSLAYFRSRNEPAGARAPAGSSAPPASPAPADAGASGRPAADSEAAGDIVAVPATKKYHRPECRYASASGAERMSVGEAHELAFTPCGVCKPDAASA